MSNTSIKKRAKTKHKKFFGVVDPTMKTHENDPYFIKKANEAKEYVKKHNIIEQLDKLK